jgi:hypothetical protein
MRVKSIIGGTLRNNSFDNIAPAIEDAKNFVVPFIGADAYTVADEIANGKYEGDVKAELQLAYLDAVRKPVVWKAQHDFVPEGNVVFDDTGIHTQKSNEGQTAAWQWQVYDLQQLYLRKAYNGLNELLVFLDKNRDALPFWKESEAEQQRQGLFVRTPGEVGMFFDIKGSFALFLTVAPDMALVQRTTVRNALGGELYKDILDKWMKAEKMSVDEWRIFDACRAVVVYHGLARRVRTLPACLMPDGIVEYFHSDRTNIKASNNVRLDVLNQLYLQLIGDGDAALFDLNELLHGNDEDSSGAFYTQSNKAIGF